MHQKLRIGEIAARADVIVGGAIIVCAIMRYFEFSECLVSEADKPRVFASGQVYCAPNTHGESFGIVLVEAMEEGIVMLDENGRVTTMNPTAQVLVESDPAAFAFDDMRPPGALHCSERAGLLGTAPRRGEPAAPCPGHRRRPARERRPLAPRREPRGNERVLASAFWAPSSSGGRGR